MQLFLAILLFLSPMVAQCEIYQEINLFDSLGEVKAKFPNATAKKMLPAWLQADDALYEFTGQGLNGKIIIRFYDPRPDNKKRFEASDDKSKFSYLNDQASKSDDEALYVSWVRWMPGTPFPVRRLVSKYGQPEKSGFSDAAYEPYRTWESKGLTAYLTDDEITVTRIDFIYTRDEQRKQWLKRYQLIPEYLKEEVVPTKKK